MTEEQEHRAKEAARLLNEPLLLEAMEAVKALAVEKMLTDVLPSDANEIARLQAIANNTTEIRNWLEGLTLAVKPTGFDPNEPPQQDRG